MVVSNWARPQSCLGLGKKRNVSQARKRFSNVRIYVIVMFLHQKSFFLTANIKVTVNPVRKCINRLSTLHSFKKELEEVI